MRGSPLLRTLLILLALAASGSGLVRLTRSQSTPATEIVKTPPIAASTALPYHLLLSAAASEIQISSGDQPPLKVPTGTLTLTSGNPVISLVIRWKTPPAPGERRFAKLTLDPPGRATITHVFDAPGDIDDILELP